MFGVADLSLLVGQPAGTSASSLHPDVPSPSCVVFHTEKGILRRAAEAKAEAALDEEVLEERPKLVLLHLSDHYSLGGALYLSIAGAIGLFIDGE